MKNLTKKSIYFGASILLILGLTLSCSEDFINVAANEETEGAITADKAPKRCLQ